MDWEARLDSLRETTARIGRTADQLANDAFRRAHEVDELLESSKGIVGELQQSSKDLRTAIDRQPGMARLSADLTDLAGR